MENSRNVLAIRYNIALLKAKQTYKKFLLRNTLKQTHRLLNKNLQNNVNLITKYLATENQLNHLILRTITKLQPLIATLNCDCKTPALSTICQIQSQAYSTLELINSIICTIRKSSQNISKIKAYILEIIPWEPISYSQTKLITIIKTSEPSKEILSQVKNLDFQWLQNQLEKEAETLQSAATNSQTLMINLRHINQLLSSPHSCLPKISINISQYELQQKPQSHPLATL